MLARYEMRFGMEPARRFAPQTWVPQLPAASGRSRARVSITRSFTSSRLAYAFAVLLRFRDWRGNGWMALRTGSRSTVKFHQLL